MTSNDDDSFVAKHSQERAVLVQSLRSEGGAEEKRVTSEMRKLKAQNIESHQVIDENAEREPTGSAGVGGGSGGGNKSGDLNAYAARKAQQLRLEERLRIKQSQEEQRLRNASNTREPERQNTDAETANRIAPLERDR